MMDDTAKLIRLITIKLLTTYREEVGKGEGSLVLHCQDCMDAWGRELSQ